MRRKVGLRLLLFSYCPSVARFARRIRKFLACPTFPLTLPESRRNWRWLERSGNRLTPKGWPNGARVAVCISFDVDNEYLADAPPFPVPMSAGEHPSTEPFRARVYPLHLMERCTL
jgi:hypothetical protein